MPPQTSILPSIVNTQLYVVRCVNCVFCTLSTYYIIVYVVHCKLDTNKLYKKKQLPDENRKKVKFSSFSVISHCQ